MIFCMDILGNSINKIYDMWYDMWFLNGTFKCDEWWWCNKYGKLCSITGFFRGIMVYNDK